MFLCVLFFLSQLMTFFGRENKGMCVKCCHNIFSQGTEAAEPAEMAETGEVAPKSGRDAETGFWMVPHGAKVRMP